MIIDWYRKSGYNDYLSPICFAHNQARKLKESVHLNFVYRHEEGVREEMEYPSGEHVEPRIQYIFDNIDKTGIEHEVTLGFEYEKTISTRHVNYYDESNKYHNYRLSNLENRWIGGGEHVVVIGTSNNKLQFADYAEQKMWKDPVAAGWMQSISELRTNTEVKEVDYTTDIVDTMHSLRTCKMVIGYHGGAMHLAKWIGCPGIVVSKSKQVSGKWLPNFYHTKDINEATAMCYETVRLQRINNINIDLNAIGLESYLCAL